jgi:glyoxylase-like metal-dependent hydrolase (beta-lactamase superfamily II)
VNKLRLAVLALISLLACGLVTAQDHDFSKVQMKVSKVAGNVYMLEGAGGNIGASVGDDGIVVVDDQYAPLADKIQAALKGITDKPVRFIINTHYHPDHTGSNEYFQKQAPIIAHDNVRKRLEAGGPAGTDVKIIPGHGPVSSLDDVRAYLAMLKATRDAVASVLKESKTLDQMKQAKLLDPWKKYSGDFVCEDVFLETLYNSLTGQKNGKFVKHN